tara:strand:- start:3867 stop:4625 length:759 start_codon:yes stop_codon:yes gene_type:complete
MARKRPHTDGRLPPRKRSKDKGGSGADDEDGSEEDGPEDEDEGGSEEEEQDGSEEEEDGSEEEKDESGPEEEDEGGLEEDGSEEDDEGGLEEDGSEDDEGGSECGSVEEDDTEEEEDGDGENIQQKLKKYRRMNGEMQKQLKELKYLLKLHVTKLERKLETRIRNQTAVSVAVQGFIIEQAMRWFSNRIQQYIPPATFQGVQVAIKDLAGRIKYCYRKFAGDIKRNEFRISKDYLDNLCAEQPQQPPQPLGK